MKKAIPILLIIVAWLAAGTLVSPAVAQAAAERGLLEPQVQAQVCGATYTVRPGDYMTLIARRCGVSYELLVAANPQITNPWWIFPGQVLNIPSDILIPDTGARTYTVRAGDTFYRIATANGTTVAVLQAANPHITNVNVIYPGQVITIPSGGIIPDTGGTTRYTVVYGDRLSSIALRYNTTVAALLAANPWITNADVIYPGWVLVIP